MQVDEMVGETFFVLSSIMKRLYETFRYEIFKGLKSNEKFYTEKHWKKSVKLLLSL